MDLDEAAYGELPHQDLICLQIWLFSSLTLKILKTKKSKTWKMTQEIKKNVNL